MSNQNSTLTQELVRSVLRYNASTGIFVWAITRGAVKEGFVADSKHTSGYRCVRIFGKAYLLHRVAWLYHYGSWPVEQIDHINGDRSDNRISNLRCVSNAENCQNKRSAIGSNKSSGLLGVSFDKRNQKWHAYINVNRKRSHLGYHETADMAHEAYLTAKRNLHPACTI